MAACWSVDHTCFHLAWDLPSPPPENFLFAFFYFHILFLRGGFRPFSCSFTFFFPFVSFISLQKKIWLDYFRPSSRIPLCGQKESGYTRWDACEVRNSTFFSFALVFFLIDVSRHEKRKKTPEDLFPLYSFLFRKTPFHTWRSALWTNEMIGQVVSTRTSMTSFLSSWSNTAQ